MKNIILYRVKDDYTNEQNPLSINIDKDILFTDIADNTYNTRIGYDLEGWYDAETGKLVSKLFIDTITDGQQFYAKWTPATNTKYKVLYVAADNANIKIDITNPTFTNDLILEQEDCVGTTDKKAKASQKEIQGFSIERNNETNKPVPYYYTVLDNIYTDAANDKISPNGDTVVVFYYSRKLVTLKFTSNLEDNYEITCFKNGQPFGLDTQDRKEIQGYYGNTISFVITKEDYTYSFAPDNLFGNSSEISGAYTYTFKADNETCKINFIASEVAYTYYFYKNVTDTADIDTRIDEIINNTTTGSFIGSTIKNIPIDVPVKFSLSDTTVTSFIENNSETFNNLTYITSTFRIFNNNDTTIRAFFVFYETKTSTIQIGGLPPFVGKIGETLTEEDVTAIEQIITARDYYNFDGWVVNDTNSLPTQLDRDDWLAITFGENPKVYSLHYTPLNYTLNFFKIGTNGNLYREDENTLTINIETPSVSIAKASESPKFYQFDKWLRVKDEGGPAELINDTGVNTYIADTNNFIISDGYTSNTVIQSIISHFDKEHSESANIYAVYKKSAFNITIKTTNEADYYGLDSDNLARQNISLQDRDSIIDKSLKSRLDVLESYVDHINEFLCQKNKEVWKKDYNNEAEKGIEGTDDYILISEGEWKPEYTTNTNIKIYKEEDGQYIQLTPAERADAAANYETNCYFINSSDLAEGEYHNILSFIYNNRQKLLKSQIMKNIPAGIVLSGQDLQLNTNNTNP